jgi:hypothetical protein
MQLIQNGGRADVENRQGCSLANLEAGRPVDAPDSKNVAPSPGLRYGQSHERDLVLVSASCRGHGLGYMVGLSFLDGSNGLFITPAFDPNGVLDGERDGGGL